MRRLIGSLVATVLLAQLNPSPAQQPQANSSTAAQPTPQEPTGGNNAIRVSVDLVLIDVRVTDKAGKPIAGLKPEQFTLVEDGKPQRVSALEYYDIEALEVANVRNSRPLLVPIGNYAPAPEPEAVRQAVRDHRLIVLFFDLTSMETEELIRARDAAERYVREQITPADLVGVAVFGNQLKIVTHFTDDRDVLLRAIRSLRPGKETMFAPLADAAALPGQTSASEDTGVAYTADETEFNIFNTDRKLAAVESLAKLLRAIPGKKSVVHFTGGITQTGVENRLQLDAAIDAANRANVSLYTVDARGLFTDVPGGDASHGAAYGTSNFTGQGFEFSTQQAGLRRNRPSGKALFTGAAVYQQMAARHDSRDTLATLAVDTGGRPFFDVNDLGDVFRKVHGDDTGYYLLGYYSTNTKLDGRYRRVRVSVTVPNARLSYREGYYANRALGLATSEDRERQLLEAMRTESPRVELPVAVETDYFRLNDKEVYVPIAAKLLFNNVEWASKRGKHETVFDFAAEVRDQQSTRVVAALRDTVKVSLGTDRFQELQQRPIVYQGGVVLAPGNYRLKFIAREDETGRIGSFEQDLLIPKLDDAKIELSSVLLSSQIEPVTDTSEVTRRTLSKAARLKTPLETTGERIVPSVTRVFTNTQELYVFFQAYLPADVDASKMQAGLVFYRNGQYSSETPLVAPADVNVKTRTASFRVNMPLDKLSAGGYTIQAVVVQEDGEQAAFARNYFAVRSAAAAR